MLADEMVIHISEYSKLARMENKTKHDWVGYVIHWESCKRLKFDHTTKGYMHKPESFREKHKILWDFEIQTDYLILARRLNLDLIEKKNNLPSSGFYR